MLLNKMREKGMDTGDKNLSYYTPTGFLGIDLSTAKLAERTDGSVMLNGGKMCKFYELTGESNTGKSTLLIQQLVGQINYWNKVVCPEKEGADLIYIDTEDQTPMERIQQLSGWSYEDLNNHLIHKVLNDPNDIMKFIVEIAKLKVDNKKDFMVTTKMKNFDGTPIKMWIPTFVALDSMSMVRERTIDTNTVEFNAEGEAKDFKLVGNTDGMLRNKMLKGLMLSMKPICNKYGIELVAINHENKAITIGMFEHNTKSLPNQAADKKLIGGEDVTFQAFGIESIRMRQALNEKYPIYGNDVRGYINEYQFMKAKNSADGLTVPLVLNINKGYDPILSDFEFLYYTMDKRDISGIGANTCLRILPEIKFSRTNLDAKCMENPILARAIQFVAKFRYINRFMYPLNPISEKYLRTMELLPLEARIKLIIGYTTTYFTMHDIENMCNLTRKYATNEDINWAIFCASLGNGFRFKFPNDCITHKTAAMMFGDCSKPEAAVLDIPMTYKDNFVLMDPEKYEPNQVFNIPQ